MQRRDTLACFPLCRPRSNHPQLAGGSHLPDITVITPVWERGQVVFFVASRGHHAGGPGRWLGSSMLLQDGAAG